MGITGADGIVRAALDPRVPAGTYQLTASFDGTKTAPAAATTGSVIVTVERTRLSLTRKVSGRTRTVTARLVDDDGRATAYHSLIWYIDGARAATTRTNGKGLAALGGIEPGQTVRVDYAGVRGRFAASTARVRA
jgi:hypothetical protein